MEKDSILNVLNQTFKQIIPAQDKRTRLPHLELGVVPLERRNS